MSLLGSGEGISYHYLIDLSSFGNDKVSQTHFYLRRKSDQGDACEI
jgi:hypothetical protein